MKLRAEKVSKAFGENILFKNISLEINTGERICIFGPSGEGKTTILRCLCNLENFDNGEILWFDKNGQNTTGKIGMVFQDYQLFPHLSVSENMILSPVSNKLMDKNTAIKKMRDILLSLNISDKENEYPYRLSGGQKQRVAIARACMLSPDVLCFDEPTAALDDDSKKQVSDMILELSSQNMGIIIVSHDKDFVKSVSTKIFRLKNKGLEEIHYDDL